MLVTRRCLDLRGLEPRAISRDEWLAYVAADPTLAVVRLAANEDEALRAAHPVRVVDRRTDQWLCWSDGELLVVDPEPAMLRVMLRVARELGARVRHDDADFFRVDRFVDETSGAAAPGDDPVPRVRRVSRSEDGRALVAREDPSRRRTAISGDARERHPSGTGRADEERASAERQTCQALIVAGTIVCAASVMWLVHG